MLASALPPPTAPPKPTLPLPAAMVTLRAALSLSRVEPKDTLPLPAELSKMTALFRTTAPA